MSTSPEILPIHFSQGRAHRCLGCAACCHHTAPGPITDAELERLRSLDLASLVDDLPEQWYYEVDLPQNPAKIRFFATRKAHCVFLLDDGKCSIHKVYGEDAKPMVCRVFPYTFTRTPTGIFAGNMMGSRMALQGIEQGYSHEEKTVQVRKLWQDGPPAHYEIGDRVRLTLKNSISYHEYEVLESRMLAVIEQDDTAFDVRLRAIAALATTLVPSDQAPLEKEEQHNLLRGFCMALSAEASNWAASEREAVYSSRWMSLSESVRSMVSWVAVPGLTYDQQARELMLHQFRNHLFGKLIIARYPLLDGLAIFRFHHFLASGLTAYRIAQSYRHSAVLSDYADAMRMVEFFSRSPGMIAFAETYRETIVRLFLDDTHSLYTPARLRKRLTVRT